MAKRHLPIVAAMFAASCNLRAAECFAPSKSQIITQKVRLEFSPSSLQMAGRGMGSGSATKKKKKGGGGGMGGKKGKSTSTGSKKSAPFDASASLLRNERLYDDICREAFKEMESEHQSYDCITTEYLITARSSSPTAPAAVSDWVPASQIVVVRPVSDSDHSDHRETIRAAVSQFCRESFCAATISAPVFKQIPRNEVEYGAEPLDAFHRYVYDDVIEGKSSTGTSGAKGDAAMTKTEARAVLQLEEGVNDARDIKTAYRKRTFALHPDRFVGVGQTEEEKIETAKEFASVKVAYEVLSSGVRDVSPNDSGSNGKRSSWYESLGGKSRMEFYGPIDLLSNAAAKKTLEGLGCKSAVVGLSPDLAMAFVARNQAAASSVK